MEILEGVLAFLHDIRLGTVGASSCAWGAEIIITRNDTKNETQTCFEMFREISTCFPSRLGLCCWQIKAIASEIQSCKSIQQTADYGSSRKPIKHLHLSTKYQTDDSHCTLSLFRLAKAICYFPWKNTWWAKGVLNFRHTSECIYSRFLCEGHCCLIAYTLYPFGIWPGIMRKNCNAFHKCTYEVSQATVARFLCCFFILSHGQFRLLPIKPSSQRETHCSTQPRVSRLSCISWVRLRG